MYPLNKSHNAAPKPAANAPSFFPKIKADRITMESPIWVYPFNDGILIKYVATKTNAAIIAIFVISLVLTLLFDIKKPPQ